MEQVKTKDVIVSGGFYTAITIKVDIFKSNIIDERHFGTEKEAKEYQRTVISKGDNSICCLVSFISWGCSVCGF